MAQTSGFFNAIIEGGNPDRAYDAEDFAKYFAAFIGNGVFAHNLNKLKVAPGDNNLSVKVKSGRAFCNGYWFNSDSDKTLLLSSNTSYNPRWDGIVLSFDFDSRTAALEVKTGIPTPTYDAGKQYIYNNLSRNLSSVYQFCLAIVRVPANTITYQVTSSDIFDVRSGKYCGWVTGLVEQYDFSAITEQLQSEFDTWFEHMKDQLSEDAAGELQYQIDLLNYTVSAQTPVVLYENYSKRILPIYDEDFDASTDVIQLSQNAINFSELEIWYRDGAPTTVKENQTYPTVKVKIPEILEQFLNIEFFLTYSNAGNNYGISLDFSYGGFGFGGAGGPIRTDRIYKTGASRTIISSVQQSGNVPNARIDANSYTYGVDIVKIVGYGNRNLLPIPSRNGYSESTTNSYIDTVQEVIV